jgi:hypothetical protein
MGRKQRLAHNLTAAPTTIIRVPPPRWHPQSTPSACSYTDEIQHAQHMKHDQQSGK